MKIRSIKRRLSAFPRPFTSFSTHCVAAASRGRHSGRWITRVGGVRAHRLAIVFSMRICRNDHCLQIIEGGTTRRCIFCGTPLVQ